MTKVYVCILENTLKGQKIIDIVAETEQGAETWLEVSGNPRADFWTQRAKDDGRDDTWRAYYLQEYMWKDHEIFNNF